MALFKKFLKGFEIFLIEKYASLTEFGNLCSLDKQIVVTNLYTQG